MTYQDLFRSACDVEEAIGEFRTLLQSHIDVAGESIPPVLWTFERGLDRLEQAFALHHAKCHTALSGSESTAPVPQTPA